MTEKEKFNNALTEEKILLAAGEAIFFHTDGIEEARNQQEEEFGEELLTETLKGIDVINTSARGIIEQVFNRVDSFITGTSVHDDMSMVLLKIK